jgi:hypothetical protein
MSKSRIEDVLDRVRSWPPERQEDAARILMAMDAADAAPCWLTNEERADLEEALKEADRGELATDEAVKAAFSRHSS